MPLMRLHQNVTREIDFRIFIIHKVRSAVLDSHTGQNGWFRKRQCANVWDSDGIEPDLSREDLMKLVGVSSIRCSS